MNKKQFDELTEILYSRGYKRYNQHWHHEDFVIGKGFHKEDNTWEENRNAYQIILSVYDYTDKNYPNLPDEMRDHVGVEIHFDVSRTVDERIDMEITWHDSDRIEEIEQDAESYYEWVCSYYTKPREEDGTI